MQPFRVLFVCWGNICRSPTAEAILRQVAEQRGLSGHVEVDSAGVSSEHAGDPPDRRSCAEAARRGLDLTALRARRVRRDDWERFDLLLVADATVERTLLRQAPRDADLDKVVRITSFVDGGAPGDEVPDPYYGGPDGFSQVFDLLEEACHGILAHAQASAPDAREPL
jgi:protein-tyrosine phosphatase